MGAGCSTTQGYRSPSKLKVLRNQYNKLFPTKKGPRSSILGSGLGFLGSGLGFLRSQSGLRLQQEKL